LHSHICSFISTATASTDIYTLSLHDALPIYIKPNVSWGTTPDQVIPLDGEIPKPANPNEERALKYMNLLPGMKMKDIEVDAVFIGSCTNALIGDLRALDEIFKGYKYKDGMRAIVVPGSMKIKKQ